MDGDDTLTEDRKANPTSDLGVAQSMEPLRLFCFCAGVSWVAPGPANLSGMKKETAYTQALKILSLDAFWVTSHLL